MTAPDLQGYSDLILFDKAPSDLVDRALLDAAAKMPDWTPLDGNTELVLLEALSLVASELLFAINRVPSGTMETLMRFFGITRELGAPATGTAAITMIDAGAREIPAGTRLSLPLSSGGTLVFTVDATTAVSGSGVVNITAETATSAANATPVGMPMELQSAIPYVTGVELASINAGADPEDQAAWRDRAVRLFSRLTDTLVLPRHFTAAALDDQFVVRATTIDNWDPTAGGGAGATTAGHVTVAVLGAAGAFLSAGEKTDLQTTLEAHTQANLAVHVVDPTITPVDVTVTVQAEPDADTAAVQTAVEDALTGYLSVDTWDWSTVVRRNELIALISAVDGVDYVDTLTTPAADVTLTGVAPLTEPGTFSVTVTPP